MFIFYNIFHININIITDKMIIFDRLFCNFRIYTFINYHSFQRLFMSLRFIIIFDAINIKRNLKKIKNDYVYFEIFRIYYPGIFILYWL